MPIAFDYEIQPHQYVTINVANPLDFNAYDVGSNKLWLFQFGAYGEKWVAVWEGGGEHTSNVTGLEDALEEAAGWLEENAPGHLTSEKEIWELTEEVAEDRGIDPEKLRDEAFPGPGKMKPYMFDGDKDSARELLFELEQEGAADMTHTESGWLTSYEWWVDDLNPGDPLYMAIFEESMDVALEEGELDEDEEEEAQKALVKLSKKTEKRR